MDNQFSKTCSGLKWNILRYGIKCLIILRSISSVLNVFQAKQYRQHYSINTHPLLLGTCKLIDLATINHSPLGAISHPRFEGPTHNPAASTTNPSTNTRAVGMLLLSANRVRVFIQLPLLHKIMKVVLSNG